MRDYETHARAAIVAGFVRTLALGCGGLLVLAVAIALIVVVAL